MADQQTIQQDSLQILARDGYELGANHFYSSPPRDNSPGVIIFNAATATPQTFYFRCARFFAEQGFDVYTYDYRGIGQSAPATLRGFDAMMHALADHDIPGVLDFVKARHPTEQLIAMGHSVGGQLMGMLDNGNLIDKAITFSSQSGYWKLQGGNQKLAVLLTMYLVLPGLTRTFGYFPWKRLGGGENLPKGAALEWAKWCRYPNYLFDDTDLPHLDRYADFKAPILAYCFADDDWGTRKAVRSLMDHYTGAQLEYRDISPADYGLKSIGHFGYFKRGSKRLWQDTLDWIQGDCPK